MPISRFLLRMLYMLEYASRQRIRETVLMVIFLAKILGILMPISFIGGDPPQFLPQRFSACQSYISKGI